MRTVTRIGALVAVLFLFVGISNSQAQTSIKVGPRAGFDIDDLEEPYIGVEARLNPASLPIVIAPSLDYFFIEGDGVNFFRLGANALYEFGIDNQMFTPYAGAGLNVGILTVDEGDGDTEVGLNILGGARFMVGSLEPFVQFDVGLTDPELVTIGGGILFPIGGN